ncbi:MAG TPA: hypothetical protein VGU45_11950 [Microvirga sp.]|jgi:hypothetical protein|nr:hypothetical protein [Microvirga sp.]
MKRVATRSEQRAGKEPIVPRKIDQAIRLLLTSRAHTQRDAANQVGISEEHLSRMLRRDHIRAHLERRAREYLSSAVPKAAATLVRLLDDNSEHVQRDAATELLAHAGIAPPEEPSLALQVNVNPGYVVDLSPPDKTIEHERDT